MIFHHCVPRNCSGADPYIENSEPLFELADGNDKASEDEEAVPRATPLDMATSWEVSDLWCHISKSSKSFILGAVYTHQKY